MKTYFLRATSAFATLTLMSSCANIQNDQDRTRAEGAVGGAMLGALAGGIIGNQSHHRAAEGALIGGLVGGLGGLAVGDHVAQKKASYRNEEQWLDASIAHSERANADAVAYNRSLNRSIRQLREQIHAAKANSDVPEQRRLKAEILTLRRDTQRLLNTLNQEIREEQDVYQQSGSPTMRSRVNALKDTRASVYENDERLASLRNEIDV